MGFPLSTKEKQLQNKQAKTKQTKNWTYVVGTWADLEGTPEFCLCHKSEPQLKLKKKKRLKGGERGGGEGLH